MEEVQLDNLENFGIYKMTLQAWNSFWEDSETLMKDVRGKEIARQMTRSVYSMSANIEEGYGRGFGNEYPNFLRYSRGSAHETKGGYEKAIFLLGDKICAERIKLPNKIIAGLNNTFKTLNNKPGRKK
jgi:four helix bundle protein